MTAAMLTARHLTAGAAPPSCSGRRPATPPLQLPAAISLMAPASRPAQKSTRGNPEKCTFHRRKRVIPQPLPVWDVEPTAADSSPTRLLDLDTLAAIAAATEVPHSSRSARGPSSFGKQRQGSDSSVQDSPKEEPATQRRELKNYPSATRGPKSGTSSGRRSGLRSNFFENDSQGLYADHPPVHKVTSFNATCHIMSMLLCCSEHYILCALRSL